MAMESKKILIIAHFFDPCNVIASHRPKSWAVALKQAGYEPVVLTRHWTGKENNWTEFLAENTAPQTEKQIDGIRVISLPYKKTFFHRLISGKSRILRVAVELFASMLGKIDPERDTHANYLKPANELMQREQFGLILVTCNPNIGVKLGAKLSENSNVPWIADFRDLWNINVQLKDQSQLPFTEKVRFLFYDRFMAKWLKRADHIIVCNETYLPYLNRLVPKTAKTLIKNGYEESMFEQYPDTSSQTELFTILCLGTLHLHQDKRTFAEGLKAFLQEKPQAKICVKFLGVKVNPLVGKEVENLFPKEVLVTTEFIRREDALRELKAAHVLYYPVWPDYWGIYPGKLFEYLGAKKNLLIAPNDHGIIEKTLNETKAGVIAGTAGECHRQLVVWYEKWEQNHTLPYHGDHHAIAHYTREYQSAILIDLLTKMKI
jgi:glycosyltransferase involved in cell wall biosynthesis